MADKRYLVRCKTPENSIQSVVAASCEVHGECLVFLNSKGELAAMFMLEIVEGWSCGLHVPKVLRERVSDLAEWGDSEQAELADR